MIATEVQMSDTFAEMVRKTIGDALFSLSPDGDSLPVADEQQFEQTIEELERAIAYLAVLRRLDGYAVDYEALGRKVGERVVHYTKRIEESWDEVP
jgi:hypothetical protein